MLLAFIRNTARWIWLHESGAAQRAMVTQFSFVSEKEKKQSRPRPTSRAKSDRCIDQPFEKQRYHKTPFVIKRCHFRGACPWTVP